MPIRADNDPRFSRRFLIMGIVAIGFALWSLYDGMVKYPAQRAAASKNSKSTTSHCLRRPSDQSDDRRRIRSATPTKNAAKWAKYSHERGIKSTRRDFHAIRMAGGRSSASSGSF